MRILILFLALFCINFYGSGYIFAQTPPKDSLLEADEALVKMGVENFIDAPRGNTGIRLVFYNVENLFFPEDDSLTRDDDFTPKGVKGWSFHRYNKKLSNIYKTMMAVGGWEPPAAIGFCELENRKVLEDLIATTPLKKYQYRIIHEDSPDRRGIDVGFIYRKNKFKPLDYEAIPVKFPFDTNSRTRDILYIKGRVLARDTLHIFVNHWPSRWGGQAKTEPKRVFVASIIRKRVDSIYAVSPNAKIVIMGDLNDEVDNKSIVETLAAKSEKTDVPKDGLYNYMAKLSKNWLLGSHKYKSHWGTLDHMIVSAPLLSEARKNKLRVHSMGAQIFAARFLLEEDKKFLGLKPYRTYAGPRFIDGFSDHLPIYIDLMYTEK